MNAFQMMLEAMKNIKTVGTITFSSQFLMRKMVAPIDYNKAMCIVEFGAGNGVITKGILERMRPDAKLISFEVNQHFIDYMKKNIQDDRLILVNDSAERLPHYLKKHGFDHADHIISALPLVIFPETLVVGIFHAIIQCLRPQGLFIQLSYKPTTYKLYEKYIRKGKTIFTLLNIPPAFVFIHQYDPQEKVKQQQTAQVALN